jgi:transketolase
MSKEESMISENLSQTAALIRADILKMTTAAGSGHPGGSLSSVEIVTVLFFDGELNYDSADPAWVGRDRFILSKGHVAPVLYAALARAGFFDLSELKTLRQFGSRLQGHPDRLKLPGIEASTGSLGQGLSIASGLSYAIIQDRSRYEYLDKYGDVVIPRVFTLLGDGECQEGQVWEAAMFAAHQGLENLVAIVDSNKLQIDGRVEDVAGLTAIAERFRAFDWDVYEVDGHDMAALKQCFTAVRLSVDKRPKIIIADTIKGKGISFMEDQAAWHGKTLNPDQLTDALLELSADIGQVDACADWEL